MSFSLEANTSIGSMALRQVTRLSSPSDYSAFIAKFDTYILDCDGAVHIYVPLGLTFVGVIWDGDYLLPRVKETLSFLRSRNKRIIFATNRSSGSRRTYAQKFVQLGISVDENEIFGSSYSAAIYLSRVVGFPKDKSVYVLGERGIVEELEAEGISYVGGTSSDDRSHFEDRHFDELVSNENIGAVLCGLDYHITYKKMAKALTYLRQSPDVLFLATNTDSTGPHNGRVVPGAGATTVIPLQYASKRVATICGKPGSAMMDAIFARYELDRERTCMVGDRLDTDIKFGIQGNLGGTLL